MIYHLLVLSDENDFFSRELHIDSQASFLELNDFLIDNLGYSRGEMTTFHVSDGAWNKGQEITLMDMGFSSDEDVYLMDSTRLEDFIDGKGDRLLFIFDLLSERSLFIEVLDVEFGTALGQINLIASKGNAPKQTSTAEEAALRGDGSASAKSSILDDEDLFADDDAIDLDELGEDWGYDDEFSSGGSYR